MAAYVAGVIDTVDPADFLGGHGGVEFLRDALAKVKGPDRSPGWVGMRL